MKVWIDVGDSRAQLGNDGIVLHVADSNGKVGRLRIGRARVEWFPGKTSVNSRWVYLRDMLAYLEANSRAKK